MVPTAKAPGGGGGPSDTLLYFGPRNIHADIVEITGADGPNARLTAKRTIRRAEDLCQSLAPEPGRNAADLRECATDLLPAGEEVVLANADCMDRKVRVAWGKDFKFSGFDRTEGKVRTQWLDISSGKPLGYSSAEAHEGVNDHFEHLCPEASKTLIRR